MTTIKSNSFVKLLTSNITWAILGESPNLDMFTPGWNSAEAVGNLSTRNPPDPYPPRSL